MNIATNFVDQTAGDTQRKRTDSDILTGQDCMDFNALAIDLDPVARIKVLDKPSVKRVAKDPGVLPRNLLMVQHNVAITVSTDNHAPRVENNLADLVSERNCQDCFSHSPLPAACRLQIIVNQNA